MRAIILAAGVGSRLRPITDAKPKAMVRVCGRPILDYQVRAYLAAGLEPRDISVVTGYRAEAVDAFLQQAHPGMRCIRNADYASTNNMYSLHLALAADGPAGGPLFVSNGDCVYAEGIVGGMVRDPRSDLIASQPGVHIEESMKVRVDSDGRVRDIAKSLSPADALGVSIDLYKFSAAAATRLTDIVATFVQRDRNAWTEVALRLLFANQRMEPYDIGGQPWIEIDTMADLLQGEKLFSPFRLAAKKALVLDLDGTVYLGDHPIPGAAEFIGRQRRDRKVYFVTNNTSRPRSDYPRKLERMGIAGVAVDDIVTPQVPLVDHVRRQGWRRVYCVATRAFCDELSALGLEPVSDEGAVDAQAVIVGYDTELTYAKLRTAALLLQQPGMPFLATHIDKVCPTEAGPIPDIGSILELFRVATGRVPDEVFGKPNPALLGRLVEEFRPEEIAVVGDRLYTDLLLAKGAGVDFVLVLSGETSRAQVEDAVPYPDLVIDTVGSLDE